MARYTGTCELIKSMVERSVKGIVTTGYDEILECHYIQIDYDRMFISLIPNEDILNFSVGVITSGILAEYKKAILKHYFKG